MPVCPFITFSEIIKAILAAVANVFQNGVCQNLNIFIKRQRKAIRNGSAVFSEIYRTCGKIQQFKIQRKCNMSKNKRFILCGSLIFIGLVLYVLGLVLLPATIGLQLQLDGTIGNQVSKYIGLLVPLALTIGGAVVFYNEEKRKALGFSALGIFTFAITYWMNLK